MRRTSRRARRMFRLPGAGTTAYEERGGTSIIHIFYSLSLSRAQAGYSVFLPLYSKHVRARHADTREEEGSRPNIEAAKPKLRSQAGWYPFPSHSLSPRRLTKERSGRPLRRRRWQMVRTAWTLVGSCARCRSTSHPRPWAGAAGESGGDGAFGEPTRQCHCESAEHRVGELLPRAQPPSEDNNTM